MDIKEILKGLKSDMPVKFYSVDWSDVWGCSKTTVGEIMADEFYNNYTVQCWEIYDDYVEIVE